MPTPLAVAGEISGLKTPRTGYCNILFQILSDKQVSKLDSLNQIPKIYFQKGGK